MNLRQTSKLAGLSTLLLMATAADAGWKGEFLMGVEGGYAWRNGNLNTTVNDNTGALPPVIVSSTSSSRNLSDGAMFWGILGGYQATCNRMLLGLEANLDWHGSEEYRNFHQNTNLGTISNSSAASYERGTTFGLSMRAGYKVMNYLMPYIRLGMETSKDTLRYASQSFANPALLTVTTLEDDERNYRFVGGVGVEMPLYMQANVRLEYNYSPNAHRVKAQGPTVSTGAVVPAGSVQDHFVDTKQDQHLAKLAFVWNF